ncbi:MAG: glycosyltransferase [Solirubrobacterales bacterium]|nr:glycosyltransferase [Solirubrobacterales bacterium]
MKLSADQPAEPGVSVVIPNWNGMRWLDGVLGSIAQQTIKPLEVIVVDNGSTDESLQHIAAKWSDTRIISWAENRGFAAAANAGFQAAGGNLVALVNTDIVLEDNWIADAASAIDQEPRAASVATKMVDLADPTQIYDAGDFLRRDGACEQRGRFRGDSDLLNRRGEVWSACAGAAIYRRDAVLGEGGFEERLFSYLEDVELGLRLRQAGWICLYEPCVARHAGGGSEAALEGGSLRWVERNTILLIARHFPARWLWPVAYRQLAWLIHNTRAGNLRPFLAGMVDGLRLAPRMRRERNKAPVPLVSIDVAVPNRPWRGPKAGGHSKSAV